MALPSAVQVVIIACIGCFFFFRYYGKGPGKRLPPGPTPLPFVGNLLDLPGKGELEFKHWLNHKQRYGPISSVSVIGQTLVIIHDKQAAYDLLEKKSVKSSARPRSEFASNLCGLGEFLISQSYGNRFRRGRKFVHQQLGTRAASAIFSDIQEVEVKRFLLRVLDEPEQIFQHLKTKATAIILRMTYGYFIESDKPDPLVRLIERVVANMTLAAVPLAHLVDVIPVLKYIPDMFPGTNFKKIARKWRKVNEAAAKIPFDFVQRQMLRGTYRESYVSRLTEQCSHSDTSWAIDKEDADAIKWTAATLYVAGADATVSTLSSFILAMTLNPEVQYKAQNEIDNIIGNERLPEIGDRERLPYIDALVQETLRWCPLAPMGFPHVTTENSFYQDYIIPKGAYLVPALWWFLHDPEVYASAGSFDPQRFLPPRNEPDPRKLAFGYGRRRCPGRGFADSSVFLSIALMLAVFQFKKAVDENGIEIEPELEISPGIVTHVHEFPLKIIPRSTRHAELIRRLNAELPQQEGDSDFLNSSHLEKSS